MHLDEIASLTVTVQTAQSRRDMHLLLTLIAITEQQCGSHTGLEVTQRAFRRMHILLKQVLQMACKPLASRLLLSTLSLSCVGGSGFCRVVEDAI